MIDGESSKAELLSPVSAHLEMTAVILPFTWAKSVKIFARKNTREAAAEAGQKTWSRLCETEKIDHVDHLES